MDRTQEPPKEFSSAFSFLKDKFGHYSPWELIFSQLESALLWLFSDFPGFPGFALRNLVYKLLCRRLDGFAWIQPRVTLVHTDRLSLGRMVGINSGTYINAVGTIRMGDYVLIGSNVTISSGQHDIEGRSPEIFERPAVPKPIVIEDGVWIAAGAVIMPGITLRRGTVIGANSVVTKSTDEYSVMAGVPARKIRSRDAARAAAPHTS